MEDQDFEFALGERVTVGNTSGLVTGQATFAYKPDSFQILLSDSQGLPQERWFPDHMVSEYKEH